MVKIKKKFVKTQNYSNVQLENFWNETLRLERLIQAQRIYSNHTKSLNVFDINNKKIIDKRMKYVNIPNYYAFFYRIDQKGQFSGFD